MRFKLKLNNIHQWHWMTFVHTFIVFTNVCTRWASQVFTIIFNPRTRWNQCFSSGSQRPTAPCELCPRGSPSWLHHSSLPVSWENTPSISQQLGVWDRQEDENQWLSSLFENQSLLGNIKNYFAECERSNLFLIMFQVLQSFTARGHTVWAFMDTPFPRLWVQAVSIRRTKYVLQTIAKPCIRYWLGNVWSWQALLIYRML